MTRDRYGFGPDEFLDSLNCVCFFILDCSCYQENDLAGGSVSSADFAGLRLLYEPYCQLCAWFEYELQVILDLYRAR